MADENRYDRDRNRQDYDRDREQHRGGFRGPEDYGREGQDRSGYSGMGSYGEHRGRGPRGYTRSDDRIREDINDRLTDDPYVDASEIDVTVSDSEVTLSGTVDHRSTRRRAEDIAEQVSGVTHVQNNPWVRQQGGGTSGLAGSTSGAGTAITGSGLSGSSTGVTGTTEGSALSGTSGTSTGSTGTTRKS